MRRFTLLAGLCALLLAGALLGARADQISVAANQNDTDMIMDVSLRDADLVEALTALFNTTNGKFLLQVEPGVVGRVARLQVSMPFEKALNAILGDEFSYTKSQSAPGVYLYKITGRSSETPSPTTTPTTLPLLAPPSTGLTSPTPTTGTTTASNPNDMLMNILKKGTLDKSGTPAADEYIAVKLIIISNIDLESLCTAFGGQVVPLFAQFSEGSTGTGGTRTNGGGVRPFNSGTNRNTNINNTGYNNGINNNGINNTGYGNTNNQYNNNSNINRSTNRKTSSPSAGC